MDCCDTCVSEEQKDVIDLIHAHSFLFVDSPVFGRNKQSTRITEVYVNCKKGENVSKRCLPLGQDRLSDGMEDVFCILFNLNFLPGRCSEVILLAEESSGTEKR